LPDAWVYLLRCRDASLYTGWTVDLQSRLPVELVLAILMPDKSAARREEARIKRLPRLAKLALIADLEDQRQAG
jgi:putative endonuclease